MLIADYDIGKLNSLAYILRCLGRGLVLLGQAQLRKFILIPLLVNLILFASAWVLAGYFFADLVDWAIPSWLHWLHWLLWPLFGLVLVLITFCSFTVMANLLASPFYAMLAERAEELLTGIPPRPKASFASAVIREMGAEFRRLGYFLLRAIPLAVLTLIPGVNLVAPFLWLVFTAWFLGLEYTAYPLANHGILFPEARRLLARARLGGLTLGGVVMLGSGIPLVNMLLPPTVVIAATLYFVNARLR